MASLSGDKARYLDFCREHPVPLHLQPWWLDAVCGPDAWSAATVSGLLEGAWPFFRTRRWGLPVVQNPLLTAYAGPWLANPDPSWPTHKYLTLAYRTLDKLSKKLPDTRLFQQTCRPEIQHGLPLLWAGFRQTTRYTYLLPDTSDPDRLFRGLKNTLRTDLRHADEHLEIAPETEPEPLFALNRLSFSRKGRSQPYSLDLFQRLHAALAKRGQGAGFLAKDRERGTACAALFLAFDSQQAGVVLTGVDTTCKQPGALHALYWRAIQFCSERGIGLDFEGSMDAGIEHVFRAFGGQPVPYFQIRRWLW
ncbi:MAG: GNAT family N-acetyltransferase [Saprospiraceae bacterium]